MLLPEKEVDNIIDLALAEDISYGDVTSEALIPTELQGKASILVKAEGILAGGEVAKRLFLKVDPSLRVEVLIRDGARVQPGDIVATIFGSVFSVLKAERVALNFLQRLSGIASQTAQYIAKTHGFIVSITDTRKTTPGLRLLEKYAVRMGGGQNHRFHLGDGILIKDNHLVVLRALSMSLKDIITRAKQSAPQGLKVEVEVNTAQEALDAVEAGADIIMLDNMSPDEMRRVVGLVSGQVKIEASGGITLENIRPVAMAGVDTISIGALTHSPKALDISLELEPQTLKVV
ncbi:MAG TPA: carboxylating nicotinate-nucleotide diphosphorylase [Dehalococcoidia bacterium]|jgi:nicotinate-nucleotide pyrophosphorylase (carboxylating)|nr:carboxylating nicotinate-nucleotide diphosphorylase [Dehalococcoidia bacterium]